jgi:hypothetical protein
MLADQIPAESGWNPIMVRSRPNLAKMAGIRPDLIGSGRIWPKWPESDNGNRTLPDSDNSCIFTFHNFFMRTKRRKIFSRKLFFSKNDFVKTILRRNKRSIT